MLRKSSSYLREQDAGSHVAVSWSKEQPSEMASCRDIPQCCCEGRYWAESRAFLCVAKTSTAKMMNVENVMINDMSFLREEISPREEN